MSADRKGLQIKAAADTDPPEGNNLRVETPLREAQRAVVSAVDEW